MIQHRIECVDIGSEFCPCHLAETNDCLICSHLQGKEFCDCNWRGVCVYQEYVWNGNKSKNLRSEIVCKIEEKIEYKSNLTILKIKTSRTLSRQLKEPGAYVFLRDIRLPHYYDVPMSIMDADDMNGYIYIAYQTIGAKTKMLKKLNNEVLVRGPFWNGLIGIKYIKSTRNKNCLILARGIAQAPTLAVIRKLNRNGCNLKVILDKGKIDEIFLSKYLKNFKVNYTETDLMKNEGKLLINNILAEKKYDLIYIGGSNLLQKHILKILEKNNCISKLVITNNEKFCCGEGICGSCTTFTQNGELIKTCKTQMDVKKTVERRNMLG
ncbi:sulfide/dihydroorotate dehydrogenase-like FAD/NAD-binding protein [Caloranaerobacter sp. TR13]|uniref:sulfide/dihydroorotate dehydrogenase-like FAD/NAD-binding protein n=1 Tax=Caloranaerobacter sp. TR13 TaxID=1302151 RepID=UPI0006D3AD5C|nr:sulfide/dihydroorotate dehydrogenase-like FAD/NAD-binding protein [Caloranaerobacter sp. TR13]